MATLITNKTTGFFSGKNPVIIGGSVAGLALTGALAQKRKDWQVTLISEPLQESRRLKSGCTLRGPALSLLAHAVGASVEALVESMTGSKGLFYGVSVGSACDRGGSVYYDPPAKIESGTFPSQPVGLSTRHDRILAGLREYILKMPNVRIRTEFFQDWGDCPVIDATPSNFISQKFPMRFVSVTQAPLRISAKGLRGSLNPGEAYAVLTKFSDGVHLALFSPFFDPLSVEASWYGINTKIINFDANPEVERHYVREGLELHSQSLGFEFVDPGETLSSAIVPILDNPHIVVGDSFNAYAAFDSGAPAIAADGMFAMVTGAVAWLENNNLEDVKRALKYIRTRNQMAQNLMTKIPFALTRQALRWVPTLLTKNMKPGWKPVHLPASQGGQG